MYHAVYNTAKGKEMKLNKKLLKKENRAKLAMALSKYGEKLEMLSKRAPAPKGAIRYQLWQLMF